MSNKIQELKFGDIICVKSFNFIGWAIGNSFHVDSPLKWYIGTESQRKRPSNHNGLIGYKDNEFVIYEALADGIVITPIQEYIDDVERRKCEIKILRTKIPTRDGYVRAHPCFYLDEKGWNAEIMYNEGDIYTTTPNVDMFTDVDIYTKGRREDKDLPYQYYSNIASPIEYAYHKIHTESSVAKNTKVSKTVAPDNPNLWTPKPYVSPGQCIVDAGAAILKFDGVGGKKFKDW